MNNILIFLFLIPFDLSKEISVRILSKYSLKEIYIISDEKRYFVKIYKKDSIIVNGTKQKEFFIGSHNPILIKNKNFQRKYKGKIRIYNKNYELFLINHVNLRDYLSSVIVAEIGNSIFEALKAQAVLSRTLALYNSRHKGYDYDFCDLTNCQVYMGVMDESYLSKKAVSETDGEVLTYKGRLIEPFYSACCGGITSSPIEIFNNDIFYIRQNVDTFCKKSKHAFWKYRLDKSKIGDIKIIERGESGRVKNVYVNGKVVMGWDFRNIISRKYGWNTLKSNFFDLKEEKNYYIFEGKGLGHGLGMCQEGAKSMALRGFKYTDIINFYFKDIKIEKLKFEYEVYKDKNFVVLSSNIKNYLPFIRNAYYKFKKICEENGIEFRDFFVIKEALNYFDFTEKTKIKPFYAGYIKDDTIIVAPFSLLLKYSIIEEVLVHEFLHIALSKYNLKGEIEEGIIYFLSPYRLENESFKNLKSFKKEVELIEKYKRIVLDSLKKYKSLKNLINKRREL
ncbi:MAG: SpoIID/LytB domain-containing protein [Candidatus Hydrothermales bacterium]